MMTDRIHCRASPWRASTAWRCTRPDETLSPEELRQRACTELLRQAAQSAGPAGRERRSLRRRRDQRSGSRRHRGAARAEPERARAFGRSVPPPLRRARERLPHRRARAGAAHPVCGDAGRGRGGLAQAGGARLSRRALPRRASRRQLCRGGAQVVQLPQRRTRRRSGLARAAPIARRSSRASCSVTSKWACCRAWCTAASACSGRGAGARAWRGAAFRVGARRGGDVAAPAGLRDGAAPVPAPAGRRGRRWRAWTSMRPTRRWCSSHEHFEF